MDKNAVKNEHATYVFKTWFIGKLQWKTLRWPIWAQ